MKLKVPDFLTRRPAFLTRKTARPRPPLKLRAATAARRISPTMDDDYEEEPTTRLSSAFFVVLILHLVAVGGIWAFNSIKAHRRGNEPAAKVAMQKAAPDATKPAIPPAPDSAAPSEARPQPASAAQLAPVPASLASSKYYQVKPNDNLTKIAAALGVTMAELQAANSPKEIAVLRPGQMINVPARKIGERPAATERFVAVEVPGSSSVPKRAEAAAKAESTRTYDVKKGDTATSIAKRMGVTVDELLKLNKVSDPKKLQLGQSLKVPAKKVN